MLRKARIVWLVAAAIVISLPGTGRAQTTDRAGIEGKVFDQGGGVLPGVSVSIESPALLGGARSAWCGWA